MLPDDSVFLRSGRKVYGAGWQYDGSSPSQNKLSFGTCFVTCGIVVQLPFCTRPVCMPVLARLVLPGQKARVRKRKKAAPRRAPRYRLPLSWWPALPPAQQPLIQQIMEIGQGPGGLGAHPVAAKLRVGPGVAGHMLAEQGVEVAVLDAADARAWADARAAASPPS